MEKPNAAAQGAMECSCVEIALMKLVSLVIFCRSWVFPGGWNLRE